MYEDIKLTDVLQDPNNAIWISDERQKKYLQYALSKAGALDRKSLFMPKTDFYYTVDGAKTVDLGDNTKTYTMLDVDFSDVLDERDNRDMYDMLHYPLTILEFASDYKDKAIIINTIGQENLIRTALELAGVKSDSGESFLSDKVILNCEDNGKIAITNKGQILSKEDCIKRNIFVEEIYNVGMSSVLNKEQMIGLVNGKLHPEDVVASIRKESGLEMKSNLAKDNYGTDSKKLDFDQDYDFDKVM